MKCMWVDLTTEQERYTGFTKKITSFLLGVGGGLSDNTFFVLLIRHCLF